MSPITVFVIDSDIRQQRTICNLARELKCRATAYSDAKEFVREFEREKRTRVNGHVPEFADRPACVVLELSLTGMDGLEFQEWLRRCHPGVPVLVVTRSSEPRAIRTALKQGAVDVLVKPCQRGELLDVLSDTVRLARQSHQLDSRCAAIATGLKMLTKCERKVLELLLSGSHTKAIANRLGTSEHTVRHQRGSIHRKCGVGCDTALLLNVLAMRLREEQVTWPLITVLSELLGDKVSKNAQ